MQQSTTPILNAPLVLAPKSALSGRFAGTRRGDRRVPHREREFEYDG